MEITYNLQSYPIGSWKLYSFTTENIAGYINKFYLENKSVLTVAGSGDHIINSILLGCKNITAFDINRNALYFSELKLLMLEKLTYNQFMDFFMIDSPLAFNYGIYHKYSDSLSQKAKQYFDELFLKFENDGLRLRASDVFNNKYDTRENKLRYNLYLSEKNYQEAKENLKTASLTLFWGDIKTLNFKRDYDIIFLSNISDYLFDFGENYLQVFFNIILKFKTPKNIIVFGYVYDINSNHKRSQIDDINQRQKVFTKSKFQYNEMIIDSAIKDKKDCILILKGEN